MVHSLLWLPSFIGLAIAAPVDDTLLVQSNLYDSETGLNHRHHGHHHRHLYQAHRQEPAEEAPAEEAPEAPAAAGEAPAEQAPAEKPSSWPGCQKSDVRIRGGDDDLVADLTDYGAVKGCSGNDCSESDEFGTSDIAACALVCATTTNCRFWTYGFEASNAKCWLRTSNAEQTTTPAEAEGFVTGTNDCRPEADFSAMHDHPVTGQVISFKGQDCPSGPSDSNLNGREFLMLGTTDGKPYYYNKDTQRWLYHDLNCNGKSGDEGWLPHWVITPSAPREKDASGDRDGDGICEAWAYTSVEGDEFGPVGAGWQVDCAGKGLSSTTLAMDVLRWGLLAEFFKVDADTLESFVPGDKEPTVKRIDSRLDYWPTKNAWRGLPDDFTGAYYAKWTGYLKITEPGDYYFSLGTSDIAYLEWHHDESNTWATQKHNGAGTFSYTDRNDHTPETVRDLEMGFHRLRVRFWRKYDLSFGLVLKYKGSDSNNTWKVVPSEALYVERPGCVVPGSAGGPICGEDAGFIIASGETCTVDGALACPAGQIADPAEITCTPPRAIEPTCIPDPEVTGKAEGEKKAKAESEGSEKAETEKKAKDESEQKSKATTAQEEEEKVEAEQKAKADAEAMEKAEAAQPEAAPAPGKSIAKWR